MNQESPSESSTYEDITFTTTDGRTLTGRLYLPGVDSLAENAVQPDDGVVVIHPATGVHMMLYAGSAAFLAQQGTPTLIYDFRGTGRSCQPSDKKDTSIRMSDWMLFDVPAANRFMRQRFPSLRLCAVGHSVGAHGQLASQIDEPVDALAMIASHAGITRLIPPRMERLKVGFIFNVLTPLTLRILGYVPVDKMGMGRSIPAGVMKQWSQWSRRPNYFFDDDGFPSQGTPLTQRYANVEIPVFSIIFTDDPWATRQAANVLIRRLTGATITTRDISPADIGTATIGHMGFFRSANKALWPDVAGWLRTQAEGPSEK